MTGLWAFEVQLPFQKYQGSAIVVRYITVTESQPNTSYIPYFRYLKAVTRHCEGLQRYICITFLWHCKWYIHCKYINPNCIRSTYSETIVISAVIDSHQMKINFADQFWRSDLKINFEDQIWRSILKINFPCQFWRSILKINFVDQFWRSISKINFERSILIFYVENLFERFQSWSSIFKWPQKLDIIYVCFLTTPEWAFAN